MAYFYLSFQLKPKPYKLSLAEIALYLETF
jgi:hypothetical protein